MFHYRHTRMIPFYFQVELDPSYDSDFFHLVKRNISGGFVSCVTIYRVANDPHDNPEFNPDEDVSNYILY